MEKKNMHRGSVFLANMPSHEPEGKDRVKPVLIVQNNVGNHHSPNVIVASMSSRTERRRDQPTHVLTSGDSFNLRPSMILCESLHTIRKERLGKFIGWITRQEQDLVDQALMKSLGLTDVFSLGVYK